MIAQSAELDNGNSSNRLLKSGSGPSRRHAVLGRAVSVSTWEATSCFQSGYRRRLLFFQLVEPQQVFTVVFCVHFKAFLQVCARLTGECRVLAGGSTVGWWEMFVVQH